MNGAVGIQKLKPQADGSVPTRQRIISFWEPRSAYVRPLRRDAGLLQMVGFLGLITLQDDEELAPEEPFTFEKSLLTSVAGAPRHKRILIGMRTVSVEWLPSDRVPCVRNSCSL